MAESNLPNGETPLRLKKFNSTGSQTTTEVLVTRISPAARARQAGLIAAVLFALSILGVMAFRTSRFNPFEKTPDGPGFTTPVHNPDS